MGNSDFDRTYDALKYAVEIVESYEMDIRNAETTIGINLVEKGFCQGRIYKNATKEIRRRLHGKD